MPVIEYVDAAVFKALLRSLDRDPGTWESEIVLPWGGTITVSIDEEENNGRYVTVRLISDIAEGGTMGGDLSINRGNAAELATKISEWTYGRFTG